MEGRITKVPYADPGLTTPGFLLFRVDHWQVRTQRVRRCRPRLLPPLSVVLAVAGAAVATSLVEAAAAATVDVTAAAAELLLLRMKLLRRWLNCCCG